MSSFYFVQLKGGEPDVNTVAKMILNDWQRGKIPFFVPPPGCEPAPKVDQNDEEGDEKKDKDQDFSQIKVIHEYDEEDMNITENDNSRNDATTNDNVVEESKNEINTRKRKREVSENVEEEKNDAIEKEKVEEHKEESKKRKRGASDTETKSEEKRIKTASGTFIVTDQ